MGDIDQAKQKVTAELNWRSENASGTARRLALGVIGVVWGLLTVASAQALLETRWQHDVLVIAGVVALCSLFADWLQAILGYCTVVRAFEHVHSPDFDPNKEKAYPITWAYSFSNYSFWAKQLLSPLSFVLLVAAVVPIIF